MRLSVFLIQDKNLMKSRRRRRRKKLILRPLGTSRSKIDTILLKKQLQLHNYKTFFVVVSIREDMHSKQKSCFNDCNTQFVKISRPRSPLTGTRCRVGKAYRSPPKRVFCYQKLTYWYVQYYDILETKTNQWYCFSMFTKNRSGIIHTTEDGSTEALLQILYGQYLILGVFGSCMF